MSKITRPLAVFSGNMSITWKIAFVLAIVCDTMDPIPVAGWIITFFFRPFLFIFVLRHGTLSDRVKRILALAADYIPIINIIPFSVGSVYHAYRQSEMENRSKATQDTEVYA